MKLNYKPWILVLVVCGLCIITRAQTAGSLSYKLVINDPKLNKIRVENKTLYIKGSKSIELSSRNSEKLISQQIDNNSEIKVINQDKPSFILKDFTAKKLVLSDNILMNRHLVNDTLAIFKWKISKERKKILTYNCIKATTQFRGRNYEAWYTEDIPIQNGPWKFCGLPGLIIKIYDDKLTFVYELTGIDLKAKFNEHIIAIPKEYSKERPITHRQFMILYKKKLEDYAKLSKVVQTSKDGGYGSVTIILPEKMEKF